MRLCAYEGQKERSDTPPIHLPCHGKTEQLVMVIYSESPNESQTLVIDVLVRRRQSFTSLNIGDERI